MKKYSTKAYYNYVKRILEGEAVVDQEVKPVDSQFKALIASAGTGAVGAVALIKYLDGMFDVVNIMKMSNYINKLGDKARINITGLGLSDVPHGKMSQISATIADNLGRFVQSCMSGIANAVWWVADKLGNVAWSGPLSNTIGSSSYSYGTVLALATAGAMIGGVVYKIYRIIAKMIRSRNTSESYYKAKINSMRKAINESKAIVKKISILTEGEASEAKSQAMAEAVIDKNESVIDEMWNWATKTPFHTIVALFIPIVSWIIVVIAICKACVACWRGISKLFR